MLVIRLFFFFGDLGQRNLVIGPCLWGILPLSHVGIFCMFKNLKWGSCTVVFVENLCFCVLCYTMLPLVPADLTFPSVTNFTWSLFLLDSVLAMSLSIQSRI